MKINIFEPYTVRACAKCGFNNLTQCDRWGKEEKPVRVACWVCESKLKLECDYLVKVSEWANKQEQYAWQRQLDVWAKNAIIHNHKENGTKECFDCIRLRVENENRADIARRFIKKGQSEDYPNADKGL